MGGASAGRGRRAKEVREMVNKVNGTKLVNKGADGECVWRCLGDCVSGGGVLVTICSTVIVIVVVVVVVVVVVIRLFGVIICNVGDITSRPV